MFWLTLCGLAVLMLIVLLSRESTQPRSRSVLSKVILLYFLSKQVVLIECCGLMIMISICCLFGLNFWLLVRLN